MAGILHAGVGRATITPPVGHRPRGLGRAGPRACRGRRPGLLRDGPRSLRDDDVSCAIVEYDTGTIMAEDAARICGLVSDATGIAPTRRPRFVYAYALRPVDPSAECPGRDGAGRSVLGDAVQPDVRSRPPGAPGDAPGADRRGLRELGRRRRAAATRYPTAAIVVSQYVDGFTDPTVTVARIDGLDGSPLAAIVGYACHPITLAFQNRLLSPDYPGVVRTRGRGPHRRHLPLSSGLRRRSDADRGPHRRYTRPPSAGNDARGRGRGDISQHRSRRTSVGIRPGGRVGRAARAPTARAWATGGRRRPRGDQHRSRCRSAHSVTRRRSVRTQTRSARSSTGCAPPQRPMPRSPTACSVSSAPRCDLPGSRGSRVATPSISTCTASGSAPFAVVGFPGEPFASIGVAVRDGSPFPVTLMTATRTGGAAMSRPRTPLQSAVTRSSGGQRSTLARRTH